MYKTILTLVIFFVVFDTSATMGWSGKTKITKLYAVSDSQLLIKLAISSNRVECNTTADGDILINPNTQKTFYNMLLAAHMAGKDVNVYLIPPCGTVHWQGPSFGSAGHVIVY